MDDRPQLSPAADTDDVPPEDERRLAERQARQGSRKALIAAGLTLVVGAVFLAVGLRQLSEEGVFDERGVRAHGVVGTLKEAGRAFDSPEAVTRFTDAGGKRIEASLRVSEKGEAELDPGDRVELIYDPLAPTRARPVDEWSRPSEGKFVVAGLVILIALGLGFEAVRLHRRAAGIAAGKVDIGSPAGSWTDTRDEVTANSAAKASPLDAPVGIPAATRAYDLPRTVRSLPAAIGAGLWVAGGVFIAIAHAAALLFLGLLVFSVNLFEDLDGAAPEAVAVSAVTLLAVAARGLRISLVLSPGGIEVREYRATHRLRWEEVEEVLVASPMPPGRLGGPAIALRTRQAVLAPTASSLVPMSARFALAATLARGAAVHGIPVIGSAIVAGRVPSSRPAHQPRAGEPASRAGESAIASQSLAWRLSNSLWILWTLGLGFTGWIAFAYIGVRSGRRRWLVAAVVYSIGAVSIIAYAIAHTITGGELPQWCGAVAGSLMFGLPVVCFIHALLARREYLRWLATRG